MLLIPIGIQGFLLPGDKRTPLPPCELSLEKADTTNKTALTPEAPKDSSTRVMGPPVTGGIRSRSLLPAPGDFGGGAPFTGDNCVLPG